MVSLHQNYVHGIIIYETHKLCVFDQLYLPDDKGLFSIRLLYRKEAADCFQ